MDRNRPLGPTQDAKGLPRVMAGKAPLGATSAEIDVERVKQCGRVDLRSGARVRLYPYPYPSSLASTPTPTPHP